jgi:hypothetical protein
MANHTEEGTDPETFEASARVSGGAFMVGRILAGIAAVAISIIGLAQVFPETLVSIATLAVGVALLFEGGAMAARFSDLFEEMEKPVDRVHWGGLTAEFLAGAAGIALGILALLHLAPMVLVPIAAIVYGCALILDSGVNTRLRALEARKTGVHGSTGAVTRRSATAAGNIQVLVVLAGLGAVTLGILGLVDIAPTVLSLVAMLGIGGANLLSGSMIGGRMLAVLRGWGVEW